MYEEARETDALLTAVPLTGPALSNTEFAAAVDKAAALLPPTLSSPGPGTLLATDLDGTILPETGQVSARTRAAFAALASRGVHILIATGRPVGETLPVIEQLNLDSGWVICANGAVVLQLGKDLAGGYRLAHLHTFAVRRAIEEILAYAPNAVLAVEQADTRYLVNQEFPPGELADFEVVPVSELVKKTAPKLVWRMPSMSQREFIALVAGLRLSDAQAAVGWTAWADIGPVGVNKATALAEAAADLGVDQADTVAFGDGMNDIEMLTWAGLGVAMDGAPEAVLAAAALRTGNCAADGVAAVAEAWLRH